MEKASIFEIEN
jgi:hypothetical protein